MENISISQLPDSEARLDSAVDDAFEIKIQLT
jgi:hypothetical protein